jgi:hypothetical protein
LVNLLDYLTTLIKKRKRTSTTLGSTSDSTSKIPIFLAASLGNSLQRLPKESDQAFKFRLETDIEEMDKLHNAIEKMVNLHHDFLKNLENSWDEQKNTYSIGPPLQKFNQDISHIYSTYAVLALSGVNKSHLQLTTRGEIEYSEFVNRIVNKYVFLSLKGEDVDGEPSEWDWVWYLKRPLHRLASYSQVLERILSKTKLRDDVDEDNRKVRIGGIKIACIATAVSEHLGVLK